MRADVSVIIFDCGNFMRVGIRHRATQTLFLSEVVDSCHCDAPNFGHMIAGLHIAIVDDALQRMCLLSKPSPETVDKPLSFAPDVETSAEKHISSDQTGVCLLSAPSPATVEKRQPSEPDIERTAKKHKPSTQKVRLAVVCLLDPTVSG